MLLPFPEHTDAVSDTEPLSGGIEYFPASIGLDEFSCKWYSSTLRAFKEPVLCNAYLGKAIYRFLWLRSFHEPLVFSLEKQAAQVILKSGILQGLPEGTVTGIDRDSIATINLHKEIARSSEKDLTQEEWQEFERLLQQAGFLNMLPVIDESDSRDGSQWLAEAHLHEGYKLVSRASPDSGFAECARYLMELSGWEFEIY